MSRPVPRSLSSPSPSVTSSSAIEIVRPEVYKGPSLRGTPEQLAVSDHIDVCILHWTNSSPNRRHAG
jgi:hypothetical protein